MTSSLHRAGGVGLLAKAIQLLDLFQPERSSWTQVEMIETTGFSRSTISRLVRYLVSTGFLGQWDRSGRYCLGLAAIDLGRRASHGLDLRRVCQPVLAGLSEGVEETIILSTLDPGGRAAVCVDQIEGRRGGLRVFERIGAAFPLHAGAAPKAILARLPRAEQAMYLAGPLRAITANTLVDPDSLRADIERTLERGYSVSREETHEGVVGVGVAISDSMARPVGSIAVAAPIQRMDEPRIARYGALLVDATRKISTTTLEVGDVRNPMEAT